MSPSFHLKKKYIHQNGGAAGWGKENSDLLVSPLQMQRYDSPSSQMVCFLKLHWHTHLYVFVRVVLKTYSVVLLT